jgi:hypothetical protein
MRLEIAHERIDPFGADPIDAINGTDAAGAGGAGGGGEGGDGAGGTSSGAGVVLGPVVSSGCVSPTPVTLTSSNKSWVFVESFIKFSARDSCFPSIAIPCSCEVREDAFT